MKLTTKQMKQLHKQLLQEKDELEQRLAQNDSYGLKDSERVMLGELSMIDNHPGDIGSELYERGKDFALNESTEHHLLEVVTALENMDAGKYGICLSCGKQIPFQRLKALPTAQYCVEHSPDPHVSDRRPVEEQFLTPPFGRTSLDERGDQNQFDGEDAWQIVQSWGNSNSPAMAEGRDIEDYNELYIESDENDGYVEPIESFLATDISGKQVMVVRNDQYRRYMESGEGEHDLEYEATTYSNDLFSAELD